MAQEHITTYLNQFCYYDRSWNVGVLSLKVTRKSGKRCPKNLSHFFFSMSSILISYGISSVGMLTSLGGRSHTNAWCEKANENPEGQKKRKRKEKKKEKVY